jgi:putative peptide zinc metalloprotease protein
MPRRRLRALVLALAGAVLFALPASADVQAVGGANQLVQVSTTGTGATQARSGIQVAPFGGQTSGSTNIAMATSTSCTDCRTVAVAYQAIFLTNNPRVVVPGNAAVAANADCDRCQTYAFAYQYELSTTGPVFLSAQGQQKLAALRQRVADLAASDLPIPELDNEFIAIKAQFKQLINDEVTAAGQQASAVEDLQVSHPDA